MRKAQLRAIVKADNARRAEQASTLIELAESYYGDDGSGYYASRGITGVPSNANRNVRASESSWLSMERPQWSECIAYAPDGTASVFKRTRKSSGTSKAATRAQDTAQARRLELLASCGNATELASGDC